jgi:hypothetical protein
MPVLQSLRVSFGKRLYADDVPSSLSDSEDQSLDKTNMKTSGTVWIFSKASV